MPEIAKLALGRISSSHSPWDGSSYNASTTSAESVGSEYVFEMHGNDVYALSPSDGSSCNASITSFVAFDSEKQSSEANTDVEVRESAEKLLESSSPSWLLTSRTSASETSDGRESIMP